MHKRTWAQNRSESDQVLGSMQTCSYVIRAEGLDLTLAIIFICAFMIHHACDNGLCFCIYDMVCGYIMTLAHYLSRAYG